MLWKEFGEVWVMKQRQPQIQLVRPVLSLGVSLMVLATGCAEPEGTRSEAEGDRPDQPAIASDTPVFEAPSGEPEDPDAQAPTGNLPEGLIAETTLDRLPQIPTGRDDPFGAVAVRPVSILPRPASPNPDGQGGAIASPTAQVSATPIALPAPPTTIPVSNPAVPAAPSIVTIPAAPAPVVPQRLSEQIRISGIIQIGNQVSVLVEVPSEGTSRPVRIGEDIITGRVRLARVDGGTQVVLVEDGVETVKTVDSSS